MPHGPRTVGAGQRTGFAEGALQRYLLGQGCQSRKFRLARDAPFPGLARIGIHIHAGVILTLTPAA